VPKSSFDADAAAWVRVTRERATALRRVAAGAQQSAHAKAEQLVIDSERRHTETALALQKATQKLLRR
jgi:hypothetical protein